MATTVLTQMMWCVCVRVCVLFCLSLTHMLMSEVPQQKESCDDETLMNTGELLCPPASVEQRNYLAIL